MSTGVVAALELEARTLGPAERKPGGLSMLSDGTLVATGGIGCAAAQRAAMMLIDAGATALVSFGLCGGLDPRLRAGTVCLPACVVGDDEARFLTDCVWRDQVAAALASEHEIVCADLLTHRSIVYEVAAKARLFGATKAAAVDMESSAIAAAADRHALPFIALRVIVDTAGDALPSALRSTDPDGGLRVLRIAARFCRHPGSLASLWPLAMRLRAARCALRAAARSGTLVQRR